MPNPNVEPPTFWPVFYRTYSRKLLEGARNSERETWEDVVNRTNKGLREIGRLTAEEGDKLYDLQKRMIALPSGRWLWVGGTKWLENPDNYPGAFNCTAFKLINWDSFGRLAELAMQGCGTGALLEPRFTEQLPAIVNKLEINIIGKPGDKSASLRIPYTETLIINSRADIYVGDSREGWVDSYVKLLELASAQDMGGHIIVNVHLNNIRPKGERLKGFGGVSNPNKLSEMYGKVADILNNAFQRKLKPVECCLIIDEFAVPVVAGGVRRSAGMRQGSSDDEEFAVAKNNLWQQDEEGNWSIDPKRDALRMANHSRVFHQKPSLEECIESVRKQYYSGEGAIQWAGEAIARANRDILRDEKSKKIFLEAYNEAKIKTKAEAWLDECFIDTYGEPISFLERTHRMERYMLNPCLSGEMRLSVIVGLPGKISELKQLEEDNVNIWTTDFASKVEAIQLRKLQSQDDVFVVNKDGHISKTKVFFSGRKETWEMQLQHKTTKEKKKIVCTLDHKFFTNLGQLEAREIAENLNSVLIASVGDSVGEIEYSYELIGFYEAGVNPVFDFTEPKTHWGIVEGIVTHNCGEIIGSDFFCNLSEIHLNQIDPLDFDLQDDAFYAGALSVGALLQQGFTLERYQYSRELDPIVGVSFTGLFDFFVNAFGVKWLEWWEAGRPQKWGMGEWHPLMEKFDESVYHSHLSECFLAMESCYLSRWKKVVESTLEQYCRKHNLRTPNRFTTTQPGGTKSLLTGASPGWHPPKASRYIRRITFTKNDPIALACIKYGYSVVPGQSDKDENGVLLTDPFDPRCTEWLVEIPCETSWANIPGADTIDISRFSALAQFDFYMQVQNNYTLHNTSSTIEFEESEIEALGTRIYEAIKNDEGYISSALLARHHSNESFPRLPFEPITKEQYEAELRKVQERRTVEDFETALKQIQFGDLAYEGPAGCDSDKCLLPASRS